MACLLGARLARHRHAEVTLAGTWPAALEALAGSGVIVEEDGERWSAPVSVASLPVDGDQPRADVVLGRVKAHRTRAVAAAAARATDGLLVTLQNGLGNREALEAAAGEGRVAAGVALLGATLLGPGRVRPTPGRVILG